MSEKRLENYEDELVKIQQELGKHFVVKTFKQRKENGEYSGRFKKIKKYNDSHDEEILVKQSSLLKV